MTAMDANGPQPFSLRTATGVERMALARMAIGAVLVLTPRLGLRPWLGADASTPGATWLARAMGGRDLAMGLGLLLAARHGTPVRGWLEAGMLADTTDTMASLLGLRRLPRGRGALMAAAAMGGAVAGRRLVASLPAEEGGNRVR